jgi:hypothetical protein
MVIVDLDDEDLLNEEEPLPPWKSRSALSCWAWPSLWLSRPASTH